MWFIRILVWCKHSICQSSRSLLCWGKNSGYFLSNEGRFCFYDFTQVPPSLSLLALSSWKMDFDASYVDQHIAAAGAWNSILGIHPLMSPLYPSFFNIVSTTSLIEPLPYLSHPQIPCAAKKQIQSFKGLHITENISETRLAFFFYFPFVLYNKPKYNIFT